MIEIGRLDRPKKVAGLLKFVPFKWEDYEVHSKLSEEQTIETMKKAAAFYEVDVLKFNKVYRTLDKYYSSRLIPDPVYTDDPPTDHSQYFEFEMYGDLAAIDTVLKQVGEQIKGYSQILGVNRGGSMLCG